MLFLYTYHVVASRVCHLSQGKGSNLHNTTHLSLRLVNPAGDFTETFGKSFGFALEKVMANLGTFKLGLHGTERLTGREDCFPLEDEGGKVSLVGE